MKKRSPVGKKQRSDLRLVIVTFYMYILFTLQEENVKQADITFCP